MPLQHPRPPETVALPGSGCTHAGRCEAAAVVAAAERGAGEARRNQLCSAHLYLGIFHEAAGDVAKARDHITQAAGPFRMDHFMGHVAVMHAGLRGWPVEAPAAHAGAADPGGTKTLPGGAAP